MACCRRGPVVAAPCGALRGSTTSTLDGATVHSYRGVPYAQPPVRALRLQRPRPLQPWQGVRDARGEATKSLQPHALAPDMHILSEGKEDCLQLSVFTKASPSAGRETKMPVVVFLHGGAFVVGSCESALYGPQVLLDRDVVLVGVNYRLGPLGWLSLGSEAAPGNLGLWDQRMALLWVRDNISAFGGDPGCVTLLGESAGAMAAMLHMVAPPSAGLFHRVIALSGTPSNLLLQQSRQQGVYGRAFAERLGCEKGVSDGQVVEFLQKLSSREILKNSMMFKDWSNTDPMPWVPYVDSQLDEPFLPMGFQEAVEAGRVAKVPVIMGVCRDEGLILSAPFHRYTHQLELLSRDWDTWAPLLFLGRERDLVGEEEVQLAREVRERYWPAGDLGASPEADLVTLKDIFSMCYFHSSMDTDSELLAGAGLRVYTFMLTQPAAFSLSSLFKQSLPSLLWFFIKNAAGIKIPDPEGVGHADDLAFLFPMAPSMFYPKSIVTPAQHQTRRNLLDLLTSFSSCGEPSIPDPSVEWRPVEGKEGEYLEVGAALGMARDSTLSSDLQFWRGIRERLAAALPPLSTLPPTQIHDKVARKRCNTADTVECEASEESRLLSQHDFSSYRSFNSQKPLNF